MYIKEGDKVLVKNGFETIPMIIVQVGYHGPNPKHLAVVEDPNKCSPQVRAWTKLKQRTRRTLMFSTYIEHPSKYINNDHITINLSAQPYCLEELVAQLLFDIK
jgi:hypothetical protein